MYDEFIEVFKERREKDLTKTHAKIQAALDELELAGDQLEALLKSGNDAVEDTLKAARAAHKKAIKKLLEVEKLADTDQFAAKDQYADLKKEVKAATNAASDAREEKVYKNPKSQVELDMGEGWEGPPAKVHPASIKGFDKLNKEQIEQATKNIGTKIKNGKQLLDDLMVHPEEFLDKTPELKEITDLMWYLRNKAEEMMGQAFEKGALSLPDSGNLMRGYFDRCQEVYNRYSSHMKGQQEKAGGSARAMDAYEGDVINNPDELLPYGMNTVLVQSIKMDGTGEERLYVKLETESARLGAASTLDMPKAYAKHGLDVDPQLAKTRKDVDAQTLPTSRPQHGEDMERTIEHGKNLVRKQKSRIEGMNRFAENEIDGQADLIEKELVPKYEAIIKAAKLVDKELADGLKKGNYKNEINEMTANLEAFQEGLKTAKVTKSLKKGIDDAVGEFEKYAKEKGLSDNAQSRVMTEVVLTPQALKPKGMTPEMMCRELNGKWKELAERDRTNVNVSSLQSMANEARRSLQRAANFMMGKDVKNVAQAVQVELDKLTREIAALRQLSPGDANNILQGHRKTLKELTEQSADAEDESFPKLEELKAAYNEAVQAIYDLMQLHHLASNDVVQTGIKKLMKESDAFIAVIEVVEEASEEGTEDESEENAEGKSEEQEKGESDEKSEDESEEKSEGESEEKSEDESEEKAEGESEEKDEDESAEKAKDESDTEDGEEDDTEAEAEGEDEEESEGGSEEERKARKKEKKKAKKAVKKEKKATKKAEKKAEKKAKKKEEKKAKK